MGEDDFGNGYGDEEINAVSKTLRAEDIARIPAIADVAVLKNTKTIPWILTLTNSL